MASLTGDDGSEDVNDFLARIRELGDKRNREDEERTRKLEEDIVKGRQERAARRAERARSISPTKDSPASAKGSITASHPTLGTSTPPLKPKMSTPQQPPADATSHFAQEPSRPTPPPQSSLSRSGTLSWQQRPQDRATTPSVRSRPLSTVAMQSPGVTPEPSSAQEKDTTPETASAAVPSVARSSTPAHQASPNSAAASMLSGKDPSWFRQTPDRGHGSAALRRSEEPSDVTNSSQTGSFRLHGLSRESTAEAEKSVPPYNSIRGRPQSMVSSSPGLDSTRLDPSQLDRTPTMSPAQGRTSPERADRPLSPTKGIGGFVQSAMLKRSDSVSKRWSAQTGGGLSRHGSVISNRGSRDLSQFVLSSPPTSAQANATDESDADRAETPLRDKDGFVRPARPETPQERVRSPAQDSMSSRPGSPSKDAKRWSPTKASWLENQINKSETPKPTRPMNSDRPEWMAKLAKSKAAKGSKDLDAVDDTESSPLTQGAKVTARAHLETKPSDREPILASKPAEKEQEEVKQRGNNQSKEMRTNEAEPLHGPKELHKPTGSSGSDLATTVGLSGRGTPTNKFKTETPLKHDFRSSLKSRSAGGDNSSKDEPEFKKAFGNLKRTETKNYKAPDTLKENILKGKTGLNATGGPQPTKRVDEFKESILAKKKEFAAAPAKIPAKDSRISTDQPVPEALARRSGMLNRTKSTSGTGNGDTATAASALPSLKPSISAPDETKASSAVPASAGVKKSGLAARFNPDLVGILARGPSPMNGAATKAPESETARPSAAAIDVPAAQGRELTHHTKGRARGPKRKPPSSAQTEQVASSAEPVSMQEKLGSYNQMKANLVGEKQPPGLRSPSARVVGGSVPPKVAPKPSEKSKPEPLAAISNASSKANSSESPQSPAKRANFGPGKNGASTDRSSPASPAPTPSPKRFGAVSKLDTPSRPNSSLRDSPAVPAKSAAARSFSSNVRSAGTGTANSETRSAAQCAVEEFFGPLPPIAQGRADIDTESIINNVGQPKDKIRTLRKQIWELAADGSKLPMPMQGDYILYEDSMYLCTHVFGSADGKRTTETYLWVGDGVPPSDAEDVESFARQAARDAGGSGKPLVLRQGKESSNFFDALGGIVVIRRGSSSKASTGYMLCGRSHMGCLALDEVKLHAQSLCSGFAYVIAAAGGRLFFWKGKGAATFELGNARLIAMDLAPSGEIEEIDEGEEPEAFWEALGSRERSSAGTAQLWSLKATKDAYTTRLFAVDDARPRSAGMAAIHAVWNRRTSSQANEGPGTSEFREINPYSQNDLAQDGIFVLDAYFEVYVLLGWRSNTRFPAFRSALVFAQEYAILAASQEDRPKVPDVHVVFSGSSGLYLQTAFRKWDERRVTTQPVGSVQKTEMLSVHEVISVVLG